MKRIDYLFTGNGSLNITKHSFKKKEYFITEMGELYEGERRISQCTNSHNYINDRIYNDSGERINIKRHQIVAQIFLNRTMKEGYVVNHKNENRIDNRLSNLEWVSSKENVIYSKNGCKNNLKLIERYSLEELEEIAREREIQAVEEVLNKVYQEGKIEQEEGMDILEEYIRGERWV